MAACRLLGLAPEAQAQIFDLYQAVLEASIQRARKEGKYDEGIVDVKGTAITLAQPPEVSPCSSYPHTQPPPPIFPFPPLPLLTCLETVYTAAYSYEVEKVVDPSVCRISGLLHTTCGAWWLTKVPVVMMLLCGDCRSSGVMSAQAPPRCCSGSMLIGASPGTWPRASSN